MKEQDFQKKVMDYLKVKGCYVVKTIVCNRSGIPDIIACYHGRFIAIEVKTGTKVTALHQVNINKINSAGGLAMALIYEDNWKEKINLLLGEI